MNTKRWLGFAFAAALSVSACDASQDAVGPTEVQPPAPALQVVDGANNGGASNFFFLPPLARYVRPTGDFDPRRAPVVEVCKLSRGACSGDPVARFTTSDGPRDRTIRAYPFDTREGVRGFYLVTWDTRHAEPRLVVDRTYRVRVLVDGSELGYADFVVVSSFWKWIQAEFRWLRDPSNMPAPHLRDMPLPIAFRINTGALPTPAPALWPNEPAGLTVMTDQPWDELSSLGWRHADRMATSRIASDPTAPMSPANVLEHVFPVGYSGGAAPAVDYYSLYQLPESRELFIGLWFKVSAPWQGSGNGSNVLSYLFLEGGGVIAVPMYGPRDGPFDIRVNEGWSGGTLLSPNVGTGQVTVGEWHRLELHLRYDGAAGAGDGVIQWWLDGELVGDYRNRSFPVSEGFLEYDVAPNWGGVGEAKTEADYIRYDHTFISGN